MNELEIFKNSEFGEIRSLNIEGQPYFVGKDITEVLGYSNSRKALIDHVDSEDKGVTKCDTLGGMQDLTIINESGLYSLILSSKMPTAKKFKRWVTNEVLPTIRKHGAYMTDDVLKQAISNPDFLIQLATELKNAKLENKVKDQQIQELQPKATYYDMVLQCEDLITVTAIAKDYGLSAKKLNMILHDNKIQYKQSNVWLLYQKYAHFGYTQTKTEVFDGGKHAKVHTYWTQKGRLFIYHLLKELGYLPLIEQD